LQVFLPEIAFWQSAVFTLPKHNPIYAISTKTADFWLIQVGLLYSGTISRGIQGLLSTISCGGFLIFAGFLQRILL
jgi:hypothetical protein